MSFSIDLLLIRRLGLHLLPQCLPLLRAEVPKSAARRADPILHGGESVAESGVGEPKGGLGVDGQPSRKVDEREEEIAEFSFPGPGTIGRTEFVDLFRDLGQDTFDLWLVEADAGGPILDLERMR